MSLILSSIGGQKHWLVFFIPLSSSLRHLFIPLQFNDFFWQGRMKNWLLFFAPFGLRLSCPLL